MKKNLTWLSIGSLVLLLALIMLWLAWPQGQDEKALRVTVEQILTTANRGDHLALKKYLSPDCEAVIAEFALTPEQALLSVQRFDQEDQASYRIRSVPTFSAGSHALVELERRSEINSSVRLFSIPMHYQKNRWQIAGESPEVTHSWEDLLDVFN